MAADRLPVGIAARAAAIGAVLGIALAPRAASAWCQMTTQNERPPPDACLVPSPPDSFPLAWRHRCTSISLSRSGSRSLPESQVREILRRSIDTWETVECPSGGTTGLHVEILAETNACASANHFTDSANVHAVIFVNEGWVDPRMHAPEAFAVTLVWHDPHSGEIWDVDMEINEELTQLDPGSSYGDCGDADRCPAGLVDLQNVLTHEMGHYFGLAHTPHDTLATMYAEAESDETLKRTLQPDDIEGICAIYPPGSLPEECDIAPRGGLTLECQRTGCHCRAAGTGATGGTSSLALASLLGLAIAVRRARRG